MIRSLEQRIREADKEYTKKNKSKAKYIALSVYGYAELRNEVANKTGDGEDEWANDMHNYNGLTILISQDPDFEDFILAS